MEYRARRDWQLCWQILKSASFKAFEPTTVSFLCWRILNGTPFKNTVSLEGCCAIHYRP